MTQERIANVIVDAGTRHLAGVFSYRVAPELLNVLAVGHRVYVPFGRQHRQAFVVGLSSAEGEGLKSVTTVLDAEPLLTTELLSLVEYLVQRTLATPIEAIKTILPGAFSVSTKRLYEAVPNIEGALQKDAEIYAALAKRQSLTDLIRRFGSRATLTLEQLLAVGAAREVATAVERTASKKQAVLCRNTAVENLHTQALARLSRARKQARILALFDEADEIVLSQHQLNPSDPAVAALVRDGLVRLQWQEVYRAPNRAGLREAHSEPPVLTTLQQAALDAIVQAQQSRTTRHIILHGVTGSGKTEVYIRAISALQDESRGAIVLVPEIVLTPQMVGRFTSRFGPLVAVLHSGLSQGERRDEWLRVRRGEARIVVGARSAIFAPVVNLGLIIIDEEHELSYKQEESPFYDARDVASHRAMTESALVIRGSATPSLEAMQMAAQGTARIVSLPNRVHARPLPPIEVVDMREELRSGNRSIFSQSLVAGLSEAIVQGHQAILFLNRRGYASFLLCRKCGEVAECPKCDISLTLHQVRKNRFLECHYCGHREQVPDTCPHCQESAMRLFGIGTEQVESYIRDQWPSWRVLRMDVDTTRKKGAHQTALQAFADGEAEILLGTQMIAKGLDFPNVSFVGVIAADTMLSVPDYRSAERTFGLLTQVAGRAGRGEVPGKTVIQTFRPDHYAVQAAAHHDFASFYHQEDEIRRLFDYPPYCEIAVFRAIHGDERYAKGAAQRFERELKRAPLAPSTTILPASPAGITRVDNQFRYQVVVKYSRWEAVKTPVAAAYQLVLGKMRGLGGTCVIDVLASRI